MFNVRSLKTLLSSSNKTFRPRLRLLGGGADLFVATDMADVTTLSEAKMAVIEVRHLMAILSLKGGVG